MAQAKPSSLCPPLPQGPGSGTDDWNGSASSEPCWMTEALLPTGLFGYEQVSLGRRGHLASAEGDPDKE